MFSALLLTGLVATPVATLLLFIEQSGKRCHGYHRLIKMLVSTVPGDFVIYSRHYHAARFTIVSYSTKQHQSPLLRGLRGGLDYRSQDRGTHPSVPVLNSLFEGVRSQRRLVSPLFKFFIPGGHHTWFVNR